MLDALIGANALQLGRIGRDGWMERGLRGQSSQGGMEDLYEVGTCIYVRLYPPNEVPMYLIFLGT